MEPVNRQPRNYNNIHSVRRYDQFNKAQVVDFDPAMNFQGNAYTTNYRYTPQHMGSRRHIGYPPPRRIPDTRVDDQIAVLNRQIYLAKQELESQIDQAGRAVHPQIAVIKAERLQRVVTAMEQQLDELHAEQDALLLASSQHNSMYPQQTPQLPRDAPHYKWKGRQVLVVNDPRAGSRKVDRLATQLLEKATEIETRLSNVERTLKHAGDNNTQAADSEWTASTKEKVRQGEAAGAARFERKQQAKRKLREKSAKLQRLILNENATVIQSTFRGLLGRRKMRQAKRQYMERVREARAESIQAAFRGHLARRQVKSIKDKILDEKKQASAVMIQSRVRGRLARRQRENARSEEERRDASARMIQAWFRGCVARLRVSSVRASFRHELSVAAAIMLQSAWRRYKAARRVDRLRAELELAYMEAAAVMLQAAWRGYLARKRVDALREEKAEVDDELLEKEWADRVKKQYVAKFFLGMKERAALRIQSLFRGFQARKRAARMAKREEQKREQREKAMRLKQIELDRKRAIAEAQEKHMELMEQHPVGGENGNSDADTVNTGQVVYSGKILLPVRLPGQGRMGTKRDGVPVEVTVHEVTIPNYQLRFGIYDKSSATVFQKQLDSETLEELVQPLFHNKGYTASIDTKPVERAMFNWVATGKPPPRKHVIAWLLDRMWFDDSDAYLGRELCLGSKSANFNSTLHKTLNPVLSDLQPQQLRNNILNNDLEGIEEVEESLETSFRGKARSKSSNPVTTDQSPIKRLFSRKSRSKSVSSENDGKRGNSNLGQRVARKMNFQVHRAPQG